VLALSRFEVEMARKTAVGSYWNPEKPKSDPIPKDKREEVDQGFQNAAYDAAVQGNQQGIYGQIEAPGGPDRRTIRGCPWCLRQLTTEQALSGTCPHCYEVFANDVVVEQTEESEDRAWRLWLLSKGADIRKSMDFVLEWGTNPEKHVDKQGRFIGRPPKAVLDACKMLGNTLGRFIERTEHVFRIENLPMEQHVETAQMLIHAQQGIAVMPGDILIRERLTRIDGEAKMIKEPDQRINLWFKKYHGVELILSRGDGEDSSLPALPDIQP